MPFYVAAPVSTFDLSIASGDRIPIEERAAEEVTHHGGRRLAAEGVSVRNPAFDVTPHRFVTAIICERGVARPPYTESLRRMAGARGERASSPSRPRATRPRPRWWRTAGTSCPTSSPRRSRSTRPTAAWCRSWPRAITWRTSAPWSRRRWRTRASSSRTSTRWPSPRARGSWARCSSACRRPRPSRGCTASRSIPVHHIAGHIEAPFLAHEDVPLPAVALIVSGGHTSLFEVAARGDYRLLARTRDDAAGEAFDKVAKLLGLGYPGGPVIDRLAEGANDRAHEFTIAKPKDGSGDFSFSGIKTAVLYHVRRDGIAPVAEPRRRVDRDPRPRRLLPARGGRRRSCGGCARWRSSGGRRRLLAERGRRRQPRAPAGGGARGRRARAAAVRCLRSPCPPTTRP